MSLPSSVLGVKRLGVGDEITTEWTDAVLAALQSVAILTGNNVLVSRGPSGTSIKVRVAESASSDLKLQVVHAGDGKVRVTYGDVYDIVPKINDTEINAKPQPELTITGNGVVYVELTLDESFVPTEVTVRFSEELPTKTETAAFKKLATISNWDAETKRFSIDPSVKTSLWFRRCGESDDFWSV